MKSDSGGEQHETVEMDDDWLGQLSMAGTTHMKSSTLSCTSLTHTHCSTIKLAVSD